MQFGNVMLPLVPSPITRLPVVAGVEDGDTSNEIVAGVMPTLVVTSHAITPVTPGYVMTGILGPEIRSFGRV